MVDCVEILYEVGKEDEGFEAVFFPKLKHGFKGEDGVSAAFILETAILGLHTVIANVRVHSICDDVGDDCVYSIKDIDGVPIVWVSGVPFFEYGSQVAFGPIV